MTNEEFFYFQQGYIPKPVIVEWLDSIVELFPIYSNGSYISFDPTASLPKQIYTSDLMKKYPRLMKAFTINVSGQEMNKVGKAELIRLVAKNLDIDLKRKHFKRAMVS